MEISIYLGIGLILAGILWQISNSLLTIIVCCYWAVVAFWASGIIHPFSFGVINWVPLLGINISYHIDGLAKIFTLLISWIGIIIFVYAYCYSKQNELAKKKLLSLLQFFAISMLGIVLINDMIALFLFWELTSVTSYLLIQFDVQDKKSNQAAFNSIFVSVMGSLVLLVGFILMNQLSHSWDIQNNIIKLVSYDNNILQTAFFLLLCGAVTKSAQFPFYFWLAGAMKAPTPVSAYLHSATMVNAGVYLLARFHPLFSKLDVWYICLSFFGLATMLCSSILSFLQVDLKKILAYTTVFALGVMIYLLGSRDVLPLEAFLVFLLFHGVYKASAFMLVGIIDRKYKTRNLTKLTGIAKDNFIVAIIIIITFSAMAGLPPFFGFTVKEMIYEAKLASSSVSYFLIMISIISSMLISATSFRCIWYFFKEKIKISAVNIFFSQKSISLILLCPLILSIIIVLFSVVDNYINIFIDPAIQAIIPDKQIASITPNTFLSFVLGITTSISGIMFFLISLLIKQTYANWFGWLELAKIFELMFDNFLVFGRKITGLTQKQNLNNQLRIFFLGTIIILWLTIPLQQVNIIKDNIYSIYMIIILLLILSALSLLISKNFLYNLISLSLVGLSTSAFFIINGAIDVAITQILVEVLTIIILLIALRSKQIRQIAYDKYRILNAAIAIFFGFFITQTLFLLDFVSFNPELKNFYINNSLIAAYGKNVVNVILVDFRSLDTFGEVIVIIATAISVMVLLHKNRILRRGRNVSNN